MIDLFYPFCCRLYAERFRCPGAEVRLPSLHSGPEQVLCVRLGLAAVVDNHKGVLVRLATLSSVSYNVLQCHPSTIVHHCSGDICLSHFKINLIWLLQHYDIVFSYSVVVQCGKGRAHTTRTMLVSL